MSIVQISARIDSRIKEALDHYCERSGVKLNHLVKEAIIDKLEELEDVQDIKKLRNESTRSFSDLLKELNLDG